MPAAPIVTDSVSLLARMKAGARAHDVIPWPGKEDFEVGLRPLTGQETRDSRFGAFEVVKKFSEAPGALLIAREAYEEELAYQMLWRAVVDPASGGPIASSVDELRGLANSEEIAALMDAWEEASGEVSPDIDAMDDKKLLETVTSLGEASQPGTSSSSSSPIEGEPSSESRAPSSPTASSFTSSQPSEPSTPPREAHRHPHGTRMVEVTEPSSASDRAGTTPTDS